MLPSKDYMKSAVRLQRRDFFLTTEGRTEKKINLAVSKVEFVSHFEQVLSLRITSVHYSISLFLKL